MKRFPAGLGLALALLAPLLPGSLHAQAPTKIFVASFGSDANDGSRGSPKRNFQAAHDAVVSGGQIVVLDTAGYGALTISKSLAVTVPPGVNGFVTVSGANPGIVINAAATDSVSLRGLIIEGGGSLAASSNAVAINRAANVTLEDCTLRNFGAGIFFPTSSTTSVKCYLRRCTLRGCFTGLDFEASGAGISAVAIASDCQFEQSTANGGDGVFASANNGARADVTLRHCIVAGNPAGIVTVSGGDVTASLVRVDGCRITGNATGIDSGSGGQVLSRGDNTLENNAAGNTFPGSYSAK